MEPKKTREAGLRCAPKACQSLTWKGVAAVAGGVSGVGALVAAVFACSSSSVPPPPPTGAAAGQCSAAAGQYPTPNCLTYPPSMQSCTTPALSCNTSPCTSSSPCLAMGVDNSGKSVANMRIRRLDLAAPTQLATQTVQKIVINQGINLAACGEGGDGTFSWLIQFDTASGKLTTGGAPPTTDPFGIGYCFVNKVIDGLNVQPISVNMTKGSDGTWSSDLITKLYVPIYPKGLTQVIVLPISGAHVKNVTLSMDNNCIGSYNPNAIQSVSGGTCFDDITSCDRWTTGGSLGGYITLEEADKVFVPQLKESLCVLLTPNTPPDVTNPNENVCQRMNGKIVATGDYCSTTNAPGGCADSDWLAASFAASAANISATPNQADCMGGGGDGGTGSADAGAD